MMKDIFKGFYNPNEDETKSLWNNKNTVFIFDTNALLLLYRCENETRDAFFEQWEKIRERVWLPYHICLEYQRNRLAAIKEHVMELENSGKYIENRVSSSLDNLDEKYKKTIGRYESLTKSINDLKTELNKTVNLFVKEQIERRISEADFLNNHDTVRDKISQLIGSRIGEGPTQDKINELEKDGEIRYKNCIPPGYEDEKKKKEDVFTYSNITYKKKFGDWFIWDEILTYADQNKSTAVVYVTNDSKKDWWFEVGGRKRGAQESLKTDLFTKGSGAELLLYSSASFLKAANSYLDGSSTSSEVIEDIQKVSEDHQKVSEDQFGYYDLFGSSFEKARLNRKKYLFNKANFSHQYFKGDFFNTFKESEFIGLREINLMDASTDELRVAHKVAMSKVEEIDRKIIDEKNDELTKDYLIVRFNNWLKWLRDISMELELRG